MPLKPGAELPVAGPDFQGQNSEKAADYIVFALADNPDMEQGARVAGSLQQLLTKSLKPTIIDLTTLNAVRSGIVLSYWLKRPQ